MNFLIVIVIVVGARVFARWTNGLYYRGFVSNANRSTISSNYDDGDKITLSKNDKTAVVLGKIPLDGEVAMEQRVIGYWPNRVRFYPGRISKYCHDGKIITLCLIMVMSVAKRYSRYVLSRMRRKF